ncbi:putative flavin-binding monooxygenase [Patellaria atrata CBS 101060]|uniref:Flavin-binding monooxygenase n=1 Tax=Patellaria atrata CBS 101060 TaxID=1346257 RepID=A0A9P4VUT5_9PEZI|nr:putative flavin-binding monooxygenase [Patellaria atrata CBS 101060]
MPHCETIKRVNAYDPNGYTYYPILIVGAGASGIAMGCRLKEKLGFDQFRIFDRQSGIGGTWWINRYPGVACDIPAILYSFSFCPNKNWSCFQPPGGEYVRYLQDVCEKYNIVDKIQLNTDVTECRWLEEEKEWEVTLKHLVEGAGDLTTKERQDLVEKEGDHRVYSFTEKVRAKVVISGVGGLVEPNAWPENVPGRENFKGEIFHSARWDRSVDFQDKDVVVIGTGCSAAQLVPRLIKAPYNAKSVTQLMRSPPWVVPRSPGLGGNDAWEKWSNTLFKTIPGLMLVTRFLVYLGVEAAFDLMGKGESHEKARAKIEGKLIRYLKRTVPEKYHEMLIPDYAIGCKRRIFDAEWFPNLNDPKIELTTRRLESVQEHSVTLGPGKNSEKSAGQKQFPADIIVLANGFGTSKWAHPLKIIGRGGKDILETMEERGGAQAYLGTAMDGFPNFFMLFGPNTATGHTSVVLYVESGVQHALQFIEPILKGDVETVEVRKEAEVAYTKDIQTKVKDMVMMRGGCNNWYSTNGWNGTVYPYSSYMWIWKNMFPTWNDWDIKYTKKGIRKQKLRKSAEILAFTLALLAVYNARQQGLGIFDIKRLCVRFASSVIQRGRRVLEAAVM